MIRLVDWVEDNFLNILYYFPFPSWIRILFVVIFLLKVVFVSRVEVGFVINIIIFEKIQHV